MRGMTTGWPNKMDGKAVQDKGVLKMTGQMEEQWHQNHAYVN
jgi:hypothetical protein